MLFIFEENYKDLAHIIKYYEKEISELREQGQIVVYFSLAKSQNRLKKFTKFLHNYVAATYSLEQTYNNFLAKGENRDGFDPQIWEEVKFIYEEPPRLFFFAIRNHFAHYRTLPASIGVNHTKNQIADNEFTIFSKGEFKISKSLFRRDYQKAIWDNGYSKLLNHRKEKLLPILDQYISERPGLSVDLKAQIIKHKKLFDSFIVKTKKIILKKYGAEYSETKKIHDQIQAKQRKGWREATKLINAKLQK